MGKIKPGLWGLMVGPPGNGPEGRGKQAGGGLVGEGLKALGNSRNEVLPSLSRREYGFSPARRPGHFSMGSGGEMAQWPHGVISFHFQPELQDCPLCKGIS